MSFILGLCTLQKDCSASALFATEIFLSASTKRELGSHRSFKMKDGNAEDGEDNSSNNETIALLDRRKVPLCKRLPGEDVDATHISGSVWAGQAFEQPDLVGVVPCSW